MLKSKQFLKNIINFKNKFCKEGKRVAQQIIILINNKTTISKIYQKFRKGVKQILIIKDSISLYKCPLSALLNGIIRYNRTIKIN